jgi:hypothetical protein
MTQRNTGPVYGAAWGVTTRTGEGFLDDGEQILR